MKTVAIIQARMGSTRLPGKVMLDLAGQPMLARDVNRVRRARTVNEVVVATTMKPDDDTIADLCAARDWPCFRGDEQDVLDRYYRAAAERKAEAIVRITSDCPLIDPAVIDLVVDEFTRHQPEADYVSNVIPHRTFPRGLDTEVFSFAALERAWREDRDPAWREHVTPYIYRNPDLFRIACVTDDGDYSHLRWTVDTPEDFEFVQRIYDHFGSDEFSWRDVLTLLVSRPDLIDINQHIEQKAV